MLVSKALCKHVGEVRGREERNRWLSFIGYTTYRLRVVGSSTAIVLHHTCMDLVVHHRIATLETRGPAFNLLLAPGTRETSFPSSYPEVASGSDLSRSDVILQVPSVSCCYAACGDRGCRAQCSRHQRRGEAKLLQESHCKNKDKHALFHSLCRHYGNLSLQEQRQTRFISLCRHCAEHSTVETK